MTGVCLSFSTPLCCALFPQEASIKLEQVRGDSLNTAALSSASQTQPPHIYPKTETKIKTRWSRSCRRRPRP